MKYGILMPYFNRLEQLRRTLLSFEHHYGSRDDWNVIVVVDPKEKASDCSGVTRHVGWGDRLTIVASPIKPPENTPCQAYNYAARLAAAEYMLPTNPECLHKVDILSILDEEFAKDPSAYVVCGCAAVGDVQMPGDFTTLTYKHKDWYQHSKFHDRRLNFCTAISIGNYWRVGGFDPDYSAGLGYADDEFRDAIEAAGTPIVLRDDALSLHQEHPITNVGDRHRLVAMNRQIYERKCGNRAAAGV